MGIFGFIKEEIDIIKDRDPSIKSSLEVFLYPSFKALIQYRIANKLHEPLKRKEQECEKKSWEIGNLGYKIKNQRREINERLRQIEKLKHKEQALDKLIPILEYYATSTIGRKQVDGTYKCVCSTNKFGNECLNYDPRPAIEGLDIINKAKEK